MSLVHQDYSEPFLLPRYLGASDTQRLFEMCDYVKSAPQPVVLDASELEFVDPLGLAVLGALLEPLAGTKTVEMPWMSKNVAGYLERMGLFCRTDIGCVDLPGNARHDKQNSLVELTRVGCLSEAKDAARRLAVAMTGQLTRADPDAPRDEVTGHNDFDRYRHPLEYSLTELFDNALTHGRRHGAGHASVWVAAQFYATRDWMRVAVVDNGCGILATLAHHPALTANTHEAATLAALVPRVSCNRDMGVFAESENQGVGLTTTNRIAMAALGRLTLVSGSGYYTGGQRGPIRMRGRAFWQGVAVSFYVKRAQLPEVIVSNLLPMDDLPPVRVRFE